MQETRKFYLNYVLMNMIVLPGILVLLFCSFSPMFSAATIIPTLVGKIELEAPITYLCVTPDGKRAVALLHKLDLFDLKENAIEF